MIKESLCALGIEKLLKSNFKTNEPALSRFFNRMDDDTLRQFDDIMCRLRKKVYSIRMPEFVLFDTDTTLLETYGSQEGGNLNGHYHAYGCHPLLCYGGLIGDLIKAQLRDGTDYCSKDSANTGRYIKFKLCSSCPYRAEVYETSENIWQLAVQSE